MVTYYTALGRLITRDENGTRMPIVIVNDKEYCLGVDELIIWSSLHWNFLNKPELEKEYITRRNTARIYNDVSFEYILKRLETRKLIVSCSNYLAADALYGLLSELQIRPIRFGVWDRIRSCAHLYFVNGTPFIDCIAAYFGTHTTPNEKQVLRLSKSVGITTAEIIQCAEKSIRTMRSEDDIMTKLYHDSAVTTDTINADSRFSQLKSDVLQAVANLYLKKKIIFE